MASENQGEGNRTAAEKYNKEQHQFVEDHDLDEIARNATDLDDDEIEEIEKAEEVGRARSKGEDPAITRINKK